MTKQQQQLPLWMLKSLYLLRHENEPAAKKVVQSLGNVFDRFVKPDDPSNYRNQQMSMRSNSTAPLFTNDPEPTELSRHIRPT